MRRWFAALVVLTLCSMPALQAGGHGTVLWTTAGAGSGFAIGLWAGLSAFDDAVNSDRKVWTSAIAGAGAGAVAGYLIGRARGNHRQPSLQAPASNGHRPFDRHLLERTASSVRLGNGHADNVLLWSAAAHPR